MESAVKTSMSWKEQDAFEGVSNACREDVGRLCVPSAGLFPFGPSRSLPMMHDHVGSILDEVMRSLTVPAAFPMGMEPPVHREAQEEAEGGPTVIRFFSSGDSGAPPCPHMFMQHVLTQLMPMMTTEEESSSLAEQVALHGKNLVESGSMPEEHVHLARRLSEVTPEEVIAHRRAFLPFAAEQNDCLIWNAQQHPSLVSPSCLAALNGLHQVRSYQFHKALNQQHEDANMFANLFLMYAFVTATAIVLYFRRKTRAVKPGQIIKAIYARPHLKQAVEKEMGQSLGNSPPTMKGLRRAIATVRWSMIFVLCLVVFGFLSIASAMSAGCVLAAYLFLRALLWTPSGEAGCSCCCCGATPQEAEEETLSEEQACCCCCQGTGICLPDCCDNGCCGHVKEPGSTADDNGAYKLLLDKEDKACCSDKTPMGCCKSECCSDGCCGGTGCCCCCSSTPKVKAILQSRQEIYEGVPVQIV